MITPVERFDAAYTYITENMRGNDGCMSPLLLTDRLSEDRDGFEGRLAASDGLHFDRAANPTAKVIGLLMMERVTRGTANHTVWETTINRVELRRSASGELTPSETLEADIFRADDTEGLNFGHPSQERELSLDDALTAIEDAVSVHLVQNQ